MIITLWECSVFDLVLRESDNDNDNVSIFHHKSKLETKWDYWSLFFVLREKSAKEEILIDWYILSFAVTTKQHPQIQQTNSSILPVGSDPDSSAE